MGEVGESESGELVDHGVERVLDFGDLASRDELGRAVEGEIVEAAGVDVAEAVEEGEKEGGGAAEGEGLGSEADGHLLEEFVLNHP